MSDSSQTLQDPSTLNKPNASNYHDYITHGQRSMKCIPMQSASWNKNIIANRVQGHFVRSVTGNLIIFNTRLNCL